MLPYLAASGHNLYTKSAKVYLQQISNLQTEHPNVPKHFEEGLHVLRRSDSLWAGLSSDLINEQVLMRNIVTGVHAHTTVNVDTAKNVGATILQSIDWKTAAEYTFKKKEQAVTLNTKSSIKIDGDEVKVDPQLSSRDSSLSHRLQMNLNKPSSMSYAVTHQLFLMHCSCCENHTGQPDVPEIPADVQYVLDGGALVQRIPWSRGAIYKYIFNTYTEYVMRKYGEAIVAFDGYEGTSTKDINHQKRSKGKAGTTVTFTEDMRTTEKDQFLGNK